MMTLRSMTLDFSFSSLSLDFEFLRPGLNATRWALGRKKRVRSFRCGSFYSLLRQVHSPLMRDVSSSSFSLEMVLHFFQCFSFVTLSPHFSFSCNSRERLWFWFFSPSHSRFFFLNCGQEFATVFTVWIWWWLVSLFDSLLRLGQDFTLRPSSLLSYRLGFRSSQRKLLTESLLLAIEPLRFTQSQH